MKDSFHTRAMAENEIPLNWQPGQVIADLYEVQETTSGGMGVVYFVKHLKWGISLAVKTPLPELVGDESAMNRFIKEAETWVNLGVHPNIASCYYVRVLGGLPRIFIEYVDGGTLRDQIKATSTRGIPEILDMGIQICRGMEYVHSHGVIHRDLKPANCLMTKEGTVKITDFGIAKVGQEIADTLRRILGETPEGSITITGSGFGTPEYMSPEQFADSKHVGKESDIYSFGVMLYEMVCGRKPFVIPEGMHQVAREHFYRKAHEEDKPDEARVLRGACPGGLNHLIVKCLTKAPEGRYKSFGEIESELIELYEGVVGKSYNRKKPDPLLLSADSLSNRGLSMLDLGKEKQAERYWEEALRNDPSHLEAAFNQGYYLWHRGKMDPYVLLKTLTGLEGVHGSSAEYWHNLILVSMDMGFEESARKSVAKAVELGHKIDQDIIQSHRLTVWVAEGHKSLVSSVAISPDSKYALSGGDRILRLWDMETGECLRVFKGQTSGVYSVAISPDGRYALSGDGDDTLRQWDMETGECLRVFRGEGYGHGHGYSDVEVYSVAISPDGEYALSTSDWDDRLRQWDMETGKCLRVFESHSDGLYSVAISSDGEYALSGSFLRTPRLWDMETGECLRVFEGHTEEVRSVAISPNGRYALSGSLDRTLRLWDIRTGECLRVFEGHTAGVRSVAISPDGEYALSGGDETLRQWDMETGECLRVFRGHTQNVQSVAISPDGKYALSNSWDCTLRLWNMARKDKLFQYIICRPLHFEEVRGQDEQVRSMILKASALINMKRFGEAYALLTVIRKIRGYSRTPKVLGMIRLCGLYAKQGKKRLDNFWILHSLQGHTAGVLSVAISPDGEYALSGGDDALRQWDVETGECLRVFEGHAGTVKSVAVCPDGRYAVSGSEDLTLRLWDMETGECLRVFEGHTGIVKSLELSPYGLDINYVRSVAISSDGEYVLSGGDDQTLRLWDMETGECLRVFEGHTDTVNSVAISHDGRFLLSGSDDNTLNIWELDWAYEFNELPENAYAWNSKGIELGKLGKYQEAIACFDRALERNPRDEEALHNKGTILNNQGVALRRLGKYKEAIDCFDRALEINPKDGGAWFNKGIALRNLGKLQDAIACCDTSIELDPKNSVAWFVKALSEDKIGRGQDAAFSYKRFIELAPPQYRKNIEDARRRLKELGDNR